MRRKRLRCVLLLLALTLWGAIVHWYWSHVLRYKPTAIIPLGPERQFQGTMQTGEIVLVARKDKEFMVGPIRVFDPLSGQEVRSFSPRQMVKAFSKHNQFAAVVEPGRLVVQSLQTGETVFRAAGLAEPFQVAISDDGRRVAFFTSPVVSVWDTHQNHELWSKAYLEAPSFGRNETASSGWRSSVDGLAGFLGNDLVELRYRGPDPDFPNWLNVTTSAPDERFRGMNLTEVSPDGQLVMLQNPRRLETRICRTSDGRRLWSAPIRLEPRFSSDCASVLTLGERMLPGGEMRVFVIRWDAWEGPQETVETSADQLTAIGRQREPLNGLLSEDETRTVCIRMAPRWQAPPSLVSVVRGFGISWSGVIGTVRERAEIAHQPSGAILGTIEPGEIARIPIHDGFLVHDATEVRCYLFSPPGNWSWLIGSLIGPPLSVGCLVEVGRKLRSRKSAKTAG